MSRNTGVAERERRERAAFRERVRELYETGAKDSLIAMILKVTESQVRHARMRMGLKSRYRQYLEKMVQKEKEDNTDEAEVQLRADVYFWRASWKLSDQQIAERVGKPLEVVVAILAEMPANWTSWSEGKRDGIGTAYTKRLKGCRRGGKRRMVS